MKNFNNIAWIQALSKIDFTSPQISNPITIEEEAMSLSDKINRALDIITPFKTFTIKPKYIHGLSQEAKILMKDRDKSRSNLKNSQLYIDRVRLNHQTLKTL